MRIAINTKHVFDEDGIPYNDFFGKSVWIEMPCLLIQGDLLSWSIFPDDFQEMLNEYYPKEYESDKFFEVGYRHGFNKDKMGIFQFVSIIRVGMVERYYT